MYKRTKKKSLDMFMYTNILKNIKLNLKYY